MNKAQEIVKVMWRAVFCFWIGFFVSASLVGWLAARVAHIEMITTIMWASFAVVGLLEWRLRYVEWRLRRAKRV